MLPIDELRFGWLGLNRGSSGGVLRIHPNIGVGHRAVSDLVEAGRPRPPKSPRYPMAVVMAPLYTLLGGGYVTWNMITEDDVEPTVRDLTEVIGRIAIPFIHRFVTLEDFIDGMRAGLAGGGAEYDLPAALMLAGRTDEAEAELRSGLDERVGREWAESYRRFADFLVPGITATPGILPTVPEPASIRTSREAIAAGLRSYGETELAATVARLPDVQMEQIGARAFVIATGIGRGGPTGMLLAKALSLAAIEIIEGQPRALHRQRRDLKARA